MVQTAYLMRGQVWSKAGIAKDCKDHAGERMNIQWESVDWADKDAGL